MTLSAALSILANVGLFLLFLDVKRQNDALVKAVNYYQGVIEKLVRKNEKEDIFIVEWDKFDYINQRLS